MKMVIVTVTYHYNSQQKSYDMEIPCNVPVKILKNHIAQVLKSYTKGQLVFDAHKLHLSCRRLERTLLPDETFEQANIWNGAHIDLK